MNTNDVSTDEQSVDGPDGIVAKYLELYFVLGRQLDVWNDAEGPDDPSRLADAYSVIAKACFSTNWVSGAREMYTSYRAGESCEEIIERIEFSSPHSAFVFTHDPGPPDLQWRYEVVQEDKGWRIARLFKIEFNGKPWDYELIL